MPAYVKTGSYGFLKKIGVPEALVNGLSNKSYKVALGTHELSIVNSLGTVVSVVLLGCSVKELVKGEVPASKVISVAQEIAATIVKLFDSDAQKQYAPAPGTVKVKDTLFPFDSSDSPVAKAKPLAGSNEAASLSGTELVHLRDATALYQRVMGTSQGSVYVVVGIAADVKFAVKLTTVNLSVRVETTGGKIAGPLLIVLQKLGFGSKGSYASGHYSCANASPERVLGAVLFGSGLKFDTVMPDLEKVRILCSK